jgi:hypothetical protein
LQEAIKIIGEADEGTFVQVGGSCTNLQASAAVVDKQVPLSLMVYNRLHTDCTTLAVTLRGGCSGLMF